MLLRLALFTALITFTYTSAKAQIIIDNTPTAAQLVTGTLIGPGLTTSNITFSGGAVQIGRFYENTSNIGLDSGVVMSSGDINTIPTGTLSTDLSGPGDADVLATAQSVSSNPQVGQINSTFDAAVLEFDFVPTGEQVVFNFVFASDEYTTYINTQYNDAFGFYLSGPNPAGGNYTVENLALVPGTTEPITISTIYNDPNQTPPSLNGQYYLDNAVGHDWNGFTIPIQIKFDVICDSTYHFKFAVADCQDGILDTGVFLEGGSFQSVPIDLTLETNVSGGGNGNVPDSVIIEGCGTTADLVFTRPVCQSTDSLISAVTITGTAINGVDYDPLPDTIIFLPDSTEITIPFSAIQDGNFEGYESVIISITNILPNGDTIISSGTLWINDNQNVEVVTSDTSICGQDSVDIFAVGINGIPPYSYVWSTSPSDTTTMDTIAVPANVNGITDYYVTIVDGCGFTDTDTITVEVQVPDASFTMSTNNGCIPHDVVFTNTSSNATNYEWDFGNGNTSSVTNTNPITQTFTANATIELIASTALNCSDTATASVTVEPCGCTDPEATNYNPLATIDDGSCFYPDPEVEAPNIFTPNGDNENDLYEFDLKNVEEMELIITNRWGNVMYESVGTNPVWDGLNPNGGEAEEGTYFYSYVAKGPSGKEVTGHGFLQLVRD